MKERPILFSAPMVRALLECRKTQTRRIIKSFDCGDMPSDDVLANATPLGASFFCPYGAPGDRLWVREAHAIVGNVDPGWVLYRASGYREECQRLKLENCPPGEEVRWRPSIHMPRWASRILLEISAVRVERLQDISSTHALAEGVSPSNAAFYGAVGAYRLLWESINGPGSWDANPWVWVVEFRRVTP